MVADYTRQVEARRREEARKRLAEMERRTKQDQRAAAINRQIRNEQAYPLAAYCAEVLDIIVKDLKRQNLLSQDACMKLGGISDAAMNELKRQTPKKLEAG